MGNGFPGGRKSPRIRDYDYSRANTYFVTLTTGVPWPYFGAVVEEQMVLNPAGEMVREWWRKLPDRFPGVRLDAVVVMPDHLHGLVLLGDAPEQPATTLPAVIGWFKTMTTNAYIRGVKEAGWEPFPGTLWHRSFHDHIVRDRDDLRRIRAYIAANPARWSARTDAQVQDTGLERTRCSGMAGR